MAKQRQLAWGILSTGMIAHTFAKGLASSATGKLVAVGSRSQASADKFGAEFGLDRCHGSCEALLADDQVQAVYISTPHPMHAEWAIKAAEAGKHILCEKPLTLNHAEAMAVIEAARAHDVFLMEAFMYRCHPQTAKLVELIRGGAIGEVRLIQAAFSFNAGFSPESRLFAQALGGGGILDVGCYCTSMARLVAGAAVGQDRLEPMSVTGAGHLGATGVDDWAVASLLFPGGIVAELATGVRVTQDNVVRIYGSDGWILVPSPWFCGQDGKGSAILIHRPGEAKPQRVSVRPKRNLYSYEADTVARYVDQRQAASPAMTWDDTLGNMMTLDRWRDAIGLVYDMEKPEAPVPTVDRRPLAVRADQRMKYGRVEGLELPVSRLIMGADMKVKMPEVAVMFDDYFARGGNCFDTAHIYYGGLAEVALGHWIQRRGLRQHVAIIGKGAHTPMNFPQFVRPQLLETLERLQTGYVDFYFPHRDNPEVPVGEWMDAFNAEVQAGRVRAIGVSNWTLDRVQAANDYARAQGLRPIVAVSNQLSLARMVDPVWAGCVSAGDAESRAWFQRTQTALFAWSSQARRFFTGAARPDDRSDEELARCWYSPDNFQRLERAVELARRKAVPVITIALAYVLAQPFPTFALIGPRTLAETRTSLAALDLELTPAEVRWLERGE